MHLILCFFFFSLLFSLVFNVTLEPMASISTKEYAWKQAHPRILFSECHGSTATPPGAASSIRSLGGVPCFRLWSSGRTRLRGVADTIFLRRFLVSNYTCSTLWQKHAAKLEKVVDEGRISTCSESHFSHCQFGSWRFATEAD